MNPLLLLIVILIFSSGGKNRGYISGPPFTGRPSIPPFHLNYFDTFKMELLLDRMRTLTEALEKVNHLRQIQKLPPTQETSINKIQDSVDAARGFLADTKAGNQLDTISETLSSVKQMGDVSSMISSLGPILSMLSGSGNDRE